VGVSAPLTAIDDPLAHDGTRNRSVNGPAGAESILMVEVFSSGYDVSWVMTTRPPGRFHVRVEGT
jgi:hypothetical protein